MFCECFAELRCGNVLDKCWCILKNISRKVDDIEIRNYVSKVDQKEKKYRSK